MSFKRIKDKLDQYTIDNGDHISSDYNSFITEVI